MVEIKPTKLNNRYMSKLRREKSAINNNREVSLPSTNCEAVDNYNV